MLNKNRFDGKRPCTTMVYLQELYEKTNLYYTKNNNMKVNELGKFALYDKDRTQY